MPVDPDVSKLIDGLREDIKRLDESREDLARHSPPIGSILMLAGDKSPPGYLPCDGRRVDRSTYNELFVAIGEAWGKGDGSTTFNLPDLRGVFPRFHDAGAGIDAGRVLGVLQDDSTRMPRITFQTDDAGDHNHTTNAAGDHNHSTITTGNHSHGMDDAGDHNHEIPHDSGHGGVEIPIAGTGGRSSVLDGRNFTASAGRHTHNIKGGGDHSHTVTNNGSHTHTVNSNGLHHHTIKGGDSETRPVNQALSGFIRS